MGKKGHKQKQKQKQNTPQPQKKTTYSGLPLVSICTPTFNRRPFFQGLIACIANQDYPRTRMEWVVVDDGTDCVRDILEGEDCKQK